MKTDFSTEKQTEEDIKLRYITPAIEKKWDKFTQIHMEYYFTNGRVIVRGEKVARGKQKKADYLLSYKPNIPLAIVEAKNDRLITGTGMQQALEYAEILDVPFVYCSNGTEFLEHDMKKGTEKKISMDDFPSPDELWRRYLGEKEVTVGQEKLITSPYYYENGGKTPRYYQRIAINRTIEAISKGKKRALLVMATGTGKTFTAFQICHILYKSGYNKILYLADRNFLIDQTMNQDFHPFNKVMTKVSGRQLDSSFEMYFSLYQQLAGDEKSEPFRQFKKDYFDVIIVDECHRGSAKDDSLWRRVLDYFNSAIQIGMTATPKETSEVSNITYFGEPVYTYSLKQGIDDGFLAPYKVIKVNIDRDLEGWRPTKGQTDERGIVIPDHKYNIRDFDRNLVLDKRTKLVAHWFSEHLKNHKDRFAKSIIFCEDIEHAERMRQALVNENSDLVAENRKYIMKITGDDQEGKDQLDYFIDVESKYPTLVTTSMLMTTGIDCKTVKYIVIDKNIASMAEFKQIIGRGTRLYPDNGKLYFTIVDFRDATSKFADPDFDGDPEPSPAFYHDPVIIPDHSVPPDGEPPEGEKHGKRDKYYVNNVEVKVLNEHVLYYDKDGKLITESLIDYTKKNILGEYATLDSFLSAWTQFGQKEAIVEQLKDKGVLLEALRRESGNNELDDFDLICHIAYDAKPLTKQERINGVKKRDYLHKYQGVAREVLEGLLEKYKDDGIEDVEDLNVLQLDPFKQLGSPVKIAKEFGGRDGYVAAVKGLVKELYQ